MTNDCGHVFHDGGAGTEYEVRGAGLIATGFRCPECEAQTVTLESYIPTMKPCSSCGREFLGQPDVDPENCDECFKANLDEWLVKLGKGQ